MVADSADGHPQDYDMGEASTAHAQFHDANDHLFHPAALVDHTVAIAESDVEIGTHNESATLDEMLDDSFHYRQPPEPQHVVDDLNLSDEDGAFEEDYGDDNVWADYNEHGSGAEDSDGGTDYNGPEHEGSDE